MTIEEKIRRLKHKLERIRTEELLGLISLRLIPAGYDAESVADSADIFAQTSLPSPLMQYCYLAGLLLTTDYKGPESYLSLDESLFSELEEDVNDITIEYMIKHIQPIVDGVLTADVAEKYSMAFSEFDSYFNTGKLAYVEQTINKIRAIFSQFDDYFVEKFSLTSDEMISFNNAIIELLESSFDVFCRRREALQAILDKYSNTSHDIVFGNLDEAILNLPSEARKEINECVVSMLDSLMCTIEKGDLVERFGKDKTDAF